MTNITLTIGIKLILIKCEGASLLIILNKLNNTKHSGTITIFIGKSRLSNIDDKVNIYTENFVSSITEFKSENKKKLEKNKL